MPLLLPIKQQITSSLFEKKILCGGFEEWIEWVDERKTYFAVYR